MKINACNLHFERCKLHARLVSEVENFTNYHFTNITRYLLVLQNS